MCGIAGAMGPRRGELVQRISFALAHRGPDDAAFYNDDRIALGFRRLSIIDLEGGAQPIANEDESIILVCNGEIYNSPELRVQLQKSGHRFRTRSDVEVLLHLYEEFGESFVTRLRGMFAFAIWDSNRGRLMLARDHMGQKPLFYYRDDKTFLFGSEIQALLASGAIPRKPDTEALWHYLSLRCMPASMSLIEKVRKLPAASILLFEKGRITTRKYWQPSFNDKHPLSESDAIDALDECLQDTVNKHLLSDVTVGSFISGGIDSTTIASIMARQIPTSIPVFSIGVKESDFDEIPAARIVADAGGMTLHARRVNADIAELLPKMVHHTGEPADLYGVGIFLVSKLAAEHVKVVLSGDGGDESFGGYDRYLGQRFVDFYCSLPAVVRRSMMPALLKAIPVSYRYKNMSERLHWLHAMSESSGADRYARSLGFLRFVAEDKDELFTEEARGLLGDSDPYTFVRAYYDADNATDLVDKMLYTDLMMRVSDHNLVMSDRMSMANSIEVRSPFVDPILVEFAARMPASLKVRGTRLKYALRKVAERYIPAQVSRLPKQGFGFPAGRWMRGNLKALTVERLENSRFVSDGIFRKEFLSRLVSEHMNGKRDHSYRLWMLLGLEIWHDLYLQEKSVESIVDETKTLVQS